ncbi:hypothetical protein KW472_19085 [Vibrio fluvialis]|nr:hypothetical protein [Vibrio fluvialis]
MFRKLLRNKELLWTVFAQFLQMSSGVVLIKLLTSNLSLTSYGTFSLVMAASAFVLTVPFTALQQGFYRYRAKYIKENKGEEFYASMIYGVVAIIFIYILLSYFITLSFFESEIWHVHFFTIALFISTEVLKIYVRSIVNADRNRKQYSIAIVIEFVTKLIFVVAYLRINVINELDIVLLYSISNVMSILVCVRGYLGCFRLKVTCFFNEVWIKVLLFSTPLLLWGVFGWIRDSSLRWFIETGLTTADVAVFSAITSIGMIIPIAMQSLISAYIIPILYQNDTGINRVKADKNFQKLGYALHLCGVLLFFVIYLSSDFLINLFTDDKYSSYSWALPWVFISYYLFCCAMISATRLLVDFNPKALFLPNFLSGVIIPFVVVLSGDGFSFKYAILAYCLSYITYFLATWFILYKVNRSQVGV